jgi:hypothetical protein
MDKMKKDIAAKITSEMVEKLKGLDDKSPDAQVSFSVSVTELKLIARTLVKKYELREFEGNPNLY